jgi:hypothetical protein
MTRKAQRRLNRSSSTMIGRWARDPGDDFRGFEAGISSFLLLNQ